MDVPQTPPRVPWIIFGGIIGASLVFGALLILGAATSAYFYFHGNPVAPKQAVSTSPFATKARLPDDMRDVAQQASTDFAAGNLDKAAADYQQILDKYPDSLYAWSNLGVVRFQQHDFEGARTALERCVAMAPDDAFSRTNLGITYYQVHRYDDAMVMLQMAVTLDPAEAKSHNYLGCCLSQKGRQLDAAHQFQDAIDLDSHFGDAYFNLALVYATEKPPDVEQARKNYTRAIQLGIPHDRRLEKLLNPEPAGP